MLLTKHAKERIIKRLSKKRDIRSVYSALFSFLSNCVRINVEDTILFTDGRKTAVATRLECKKLSIEEIKKIVKEINAVYECIFLDEKTVRITRPSKFLEGIPQGEYCFYINKEKKVMYIGSEEPLLILTLRPAKKWERALFYFS
ncbi:hypothetical protein [Pyrococcus sp. ST04]|uniref:hypothetical protein n=1 Tax=Pyrococcus sp. ST04 TaxID=1183377 RepID=UPI0002605F4B|nr:hypothetical protein [Pyrococcus sp. ST04]AFK23291.1 hypothetical protein Py04_1722 [Pyrococcus sp. ST04]